MWNNIGVQNAVLVSINSFIDWKYPFEIHVY